MSRLRARAEAMRRYASQQAAFALEYDQLAASAETEEWTEHYRRRAAKCRDEAAWYTEAAADVDEWADTPPEPVSVIYERLGEVLAAEARDAAA